MKDLIIKYSNLVGDFSIDFQSISSTANIEDFPPLSEDENIDTHITQFILGLNEYEFDRLILPVALTNEFTNFIGIRLGIHLRLTKELGKKRCVPIIFLTEESVYTISKINPIGYFLYTEGVYIESELTEGLPINSRGAQNIDKLITSLNERLLIKPPNFYDSRHAIANEWGLIQLNRASGHNLILSINKIESDLYIKSLNAFSSNYERSEKFVITGFKNKRVLLIDDEAEKGWYKLLNSILDCDLKKVEIRKGVSQEELLEQIENTIYLDKKRKKSDYDLILLDIRLTDADHQSKDYKHYTGLEVLRDIKEKNPGVQVIILTASNKAWLFKEATLIADGFIQKKGIEQNFNEQDWKDYFQDFKHTFDVVEKRLVLKEIFKTIKDIKSNAKHSKNDWIRDIELKSFFEEIKGEQGVLDKVFEALKDNKNWEWEKFKMPFLYLYETIKSYCKLEQNYLYDNKTKEWMVTPKNKEKITVFSKDLHPESKVDCVKTEIQIKKEMYPYQKSDEGYPKEIELKAVWHPIREGTIRKLNSDLYKCISVLHFKHNCDKNDLDAFIEFTFLRNHLIGHLTGEIDTNLRKIKENDILDLLRLTKKCLCNQ